jgi:hypothetical protein
MQKRLIGEFGGTKPATTPSRGIEENRGVSPVIEAANALSVAAIEERIAPLRRRLSEHPLYASIRTKAHLRAFMQTHVFAVWDFMSLLKALQMRLTCVAAPWIPTALPDSRRFINEIVLGEESDEFEGRAISHFELYLEAMRQAGADVSGIEALIAALGEKPVLSAIAEATIPEGARRFLHTTFELIETGKLHALAAAFTFGREDVIPDMFRALVADLNQRNNGSLSTFIWYLERHIEVDGEDHGPLSLRMVADICGEDETRWREAAEAAEDALRARLALWDVVLGEIREV